MRLPNADRAQVGAKLEDYTLNPLHTEGRHKARVFGSVLGITASNAHVLRQALLDAAAASNQAEARGDNGFGDVHVLRFPLSTATARTSPGLATCYMV